MAGDTSSGMMQPFFDVLFNEKQFDANKLPETIKNRNVRTPLNFYLNKLDETQSVLFKYMNPEQQKQTKHDLQMTEMLLISQKRFELTHQKNENQTDYDKKIKRCQDLLTKLENPHAQINPEQAEEQKPIPSEKPTNPSPVAYLGITLGNELAKKMVEFIDLPKTRSIIDTMRVFNEKRLYWVWASSFIKTMLDLLPPDFLNTDQGKQTIRTPDPYTGTLSWALYYFRFSLNLGLLLKHTIAGPWMAKEDRTEFNTPMLERFKTQWAQRKFTLLNDSLWATANLVCFFWLTGKGTMGTLGDALTLGLLLFDTSMAIWDFEEQRTAFNAEMEDFKNAIENLDKLIKASDESTAKKLLIQQNSLKQAQEQCQRQWDMDKLSLINNMAYAIGLVIAFALLATPFMPIPAQALAAINLAGGILCFALGVVYNAIKGGLEIYKEHASAKDIVRSYKEKRSAFRETPDWDDNTKKLLYLEMKQLEAKTDFQHEMVVYKTMHLIRTIIVESFIPAIIMVNLIFLPVGIGIAVVAAAIGIAIASSKLIDSVFKPEDLKELEPLKEQDYMQFQKDIALKPAVERPSRGRSIFLGVNKPDTDSDNESLIPIKAH
ncbi:MAG: hypothetical protein Q8M40_07770 [Legionella sp.]|nr:hypothetical protein [Legionella sp.]